MSRLGHQFDAARVELSKHPKLRSAPKAAMAKGGGLALALLYGVADFTDWEQVAKKPRRTKGMKLIASFSW